MRNEKRFPLLLVILLGLSLTACSGSLWKSDNRTAFEEMQRTKSFPSEINSKEGEANITLLRKRVESGGSEPSDPEVITALERLNLSLRQHPLVNALLSEGLREATVGLLKDPSEDIRFRSAELLGKIATESEEAALLEASKTDPSPSVREMAAQSMELRGLGTEVWEE